MSLAPPVPILGAVDTDPIDPDLEARTRKRLEASNLRAAKLRIDLQVEESLGRELESLLDPRASTRGARTTKAELEQRIATLTAILRANGPMFPGPLHAKALDVMDVDADDFPKQALIDLLRRKHENFFALGNGQWGIPGVHPKLPPPQKAAKPLPPIIPAQRRQRSNPEEITDDDLPDFAKAPPVTRPAPPAEFLQADDTPF